jgi:hypothetical protein
MKHVRYNECPYSAISFLMDIDLSITHNERNICRIIFISKGSGAPRSYKMQSLIKNKNTTALSCILIHQEAIAVRRFHMLYFTVFFLITVQLSTSDVSFMR